MRTAWAALAASAESVASAALNRLFSVLYDWLKARSGRVAFSAMCMYISTKIRSQYLRFSIKLHHVHVKCWRKVLANSDTERPRLVTALLWLRMT